LGNSPSNFDNNIKAAPWTQNDFVLSRIWSNTYTLESIYIQAIITLALWIRITKGYLDGGSQTI